MNDTPWCLCTDKGKSSGGYINVGNQFWVHFACKKPTRLFWENQVLIHKYEEELDEIMDRILSGHESADGLDKGRAEIACLFIAMILNPSKPNILTARDASIKRCRSRQ